MRLWRPVLVVVSFCFGWYLFDRLQPRRRPRKPSDPKPYTEVRD